MQAKFVESSKLSRGLSDCVKLLHGCITSTRKLRKCWIMLVHGSCCHSKRRTTGTTSDGL